MKSFQSPLSTLEEKQYLEQLKNGSEQAKSVLIERNLRLVAHIARKYQGAQEDMEDLHWNHRTDQGRVNLQSGKRKPSGNLCRPLY